MRALGVDLGTRRIGLAVSDATGVLASPLGTIERSGDRAADHARLARAVSDEGADVVVVGLPVSLSGRIGPAARAAHDEIEEIRRAVGVEVVAHDERLTTVTAHAALRGAGRKPSRRPRGEIDQAAAAVLLQAWLDGRR